MGLSHLSPWITEWHLERTFKRIRILERGGGGGSGGGAVAIVDLAGQMFGYATRMAHSGRRTSHALCLIIAAMIAQLHQLGFHTVVIVFEKDRFAPSAKEITKAGRRRDAAPLSEAEVAVLHPKHVRSSADVSNYNRIRATPGARDTLFSGIAEWLRETQPQQLASGKYLVVGATAQSPSLAYGIVAGCDVPETISVPVMAEGDTALVFWATYYGDRLRVVEADDLDLALMLALNAPRTLRQDDDGGGAFGAPLYLFRHRKTLAFYVAHMHDKRTHKDLVKYEKGAYGRPFLAIHDVWHRMYDASALRKRRDPSPVASFTVLAVMWGCDFIAKKGSVFAGLGMNTLYEKLLSYRGEPFLSVDWDESESESMRVVGHEGHFRKFERFVNGGRSATKHWQPKSSGGIRAAFRRALWVLGYWVNGIVGVQAIPEATASVAPPRPRSPILVHFDEDGVAHAGASPKQKRQEAHAAREASGSLWGYERLGSGALATEAQHVCARLPASVARASRVELSYA